MNIVPTFASNITNDPHAAQIEAAIKAGIQEIASHFTGATATSQVKFQEGGGLGGTSFLPVTESYSAWRAALMSRAIDPLQAAAIAASVPPGNVNPITGSSSVILTPTNARALGFSVPSADLQPGGFDAVVTINTSICNLTRSSIDSTKYDLQAVVVHELDEVWGSISAMDGGDLHNGDAPPANIAPSDLFRYDTHGVRSYNTNSNTKAYFSVDGGQTDLAQFNQDAGSDFGDWSSKDGSHVPQVQDAFDRPGAIPIYNVEVEREEVLGYTPRFTTGTGIVQGTVYNDVNQNGSMDQGESAFFGWTVEAVQNGTVIESTTSSVVGPNSPVGYQLGALADGVYTIIALPQSGFTPTTPGSSYTVTITGHNATISNKDFGEAIASKPPPGKGTISGKVLSDVTGNGLTNDDTALGGVRLSLFADTRGNGVLDGSDTLVATTTTGNSGTYAFSNLGAGRYFVAETVAPGYVMTSPALGVYTSVNLSASATAANQNFANFLKPTGLGLGSVSYGIGSKTFNTLRGNTHAGDTINVTFNVTNPAGEILTLVTYSSPAATFDAGSAAQQKLLQTVSAFYKPGVHTVSIKLPSSGHYQVDLVVGTALTPFGPAGSNLFYTAEGRLVSADNE